MIGIKTDTKTRFNDLLGRKVRLKGDNNDWYIIDTFTLYSKNTPLDKLIVVSLGKKNEECQYGLARYKLHEFIQNYENVFTTKKLTSKKIKLINSNTRFKPNSPNIWVNKISTVNLTDIENYQQLLFEVSWEKQIYEELGL